jgi:hypothetical protein
MKSKNMFSEFIRHNPWPVSLTAEAHQALDELIEAEGFIGDGGKSQKIAINIIQRALVLLGTFPPDERYFTDPRPSIQDMSIWLVVTIPGKNIMVKAQYRLSDHQCVVTELWVKGLDVLR